RPPPGRTGFAGELVFRPRRILGIDIQRALDDHLLPAASDRAEGAVGAHEVPRVGEVHPLAAAEEVEGGAPAEREDEHAEPGRDEAEHGRRGALGGTELCGREPGHAATYSG